MKIGVTIGDANGIGIEVFLKSLSKLKSVSDVEFNFYGSENILKQWAEILKIKIEFAKDCFSFMDWTVNINKINTEYKIEIGKTSKDSGLIASKALDLAIDDSLNHKIDAILTLPISKEAMYLAGWKFPGHTEMLAAKCNSNMQLMILFKDNIRCALATIHKPLKEIAGIIDENLVSSKIIQFNNSLKEDFGIKSPKIAVLGLNPHSGENGNIGDEEIRFIAPAIENTRNLGINSFGPFPADGFFAHKEYLNYDGYLAMYHDQGLIPLKLLANGGGVNFTAGLPIIRTSPDHGTGFAIAGKAIANEQSTLDSIKAAIEIYKNRYHIR